MYQGGGNMDGYVRNEVMSASPAELILMLYEEGIRTLNKIELAFNNDNPGRYEVINNGILHVQDVIVELSVSLDLEKGGELAQHLQNLYDFMVNHLSKANINKTKHEVIEVREMMTEMRDAWRDIVAQQNGETGERATDEAGSGPSVSRVLVAG